MAAWLVISVLAVTTRDGSTSPVPTTRSTAEELTPHDAAALAEINVQLPAYNRAALPIVAGLIDPNLSPNTWWVKRADRSIAHMQAARTPMLGIALTLDDAEVREVVVAFIGSIARQCDAVMELRNAVDEHDRKARRTAQRHLLIATADRAKLGQELFAWHVPIGGIALSVVTRRPAARIRDRSRTSLRWRLRPLAARSW